MFYNKVQCRLKNFIKIFITTYENYFPEQCSNIEEGGVFYEEEYLEGLVRLCLECGRTVYPLDRLATVSKHEKLKRDFKNGKLYIL
ncbi:unnamed protein product [Ceutorhynchus assimilis]|uniref:Uncharacterized protein n=1 Tax=Ceutorhynchus assimilis TaxID=467358 RepID=A0A9N9MTT7_9CUCU|nr:unnamed protein product [Ceutorhynchus assimilis]CAG9768500.1 unnamed protein product [Ceutorhynchus assimilis]